MNERLTFRVAKRILGGIVARRFRFRVRPGHAFMTFSNDASTSGGSSDAAEEVVVSEAEAARLLRLGRRGLELIEVIEDQPSAAKKKLPG